MSNNVAPVYNPNGLWQIWNMRDIYTGPSGTGQYVPKVNDLVYQVDGRVINKFVCTGVNLSTMLPTLVAVDESVNQQDVQPMNVLFGSTPDTYRVLIDRSVSPYRVSVDSRLSIHGPSNQYCKLFKGTDISSNGTVISAVYGTGGNYIGENLQLELVASDRYSNNTAIKCVAQGWTTSDLANGEIVTAVIYDADGVETSSRQLIVQNSGFVRSTDAAAKAVVSIGIESPFLSAANSSIINYPVNVPLTALNLVGVVNYSNGESLKMAVDGSRFSVAGMDAYSPTVVGQDCPITLKYRLQAGEVAFGAQNAAIDHFSENYTLVTTAVSGTYQVQLYCYPVWVDANAGYQLRWFLYDLDRSINYEVTGMVQIDTSRSVFHPTTYGSKQTLSVYLNLRNVNTTYSDFTHTQIVDIVLNNPATYRPAANALSLWQVTQQAGKVPMFGSGVHAKIYQDTPSSFSVDLRGDFTSYAEWLNAYYTLSRPLFNPATETQAPTPTHFKLTYGGQSAIYSISQWSSAIELSWSLQNSDTLFIEFIRRTSSIDLQLSKIGVPMWQVNGVGSYI